MHETSNGPDCGQTEKVKTVDKQDCANVRIRNLAESTFSKSGIC
jgi:hypothetical protein